MSPSSTTARRRVAAAPPDGTGYMRWTIPAGGGSGSRTTAAAAAATAARSHQQRADREEDEEGRGQQQARRLLSYDEVPDWARGNRYIRGGYRRAPTGSPGESLRSAVGRLHNESVSVWSHLAPAALIAALLAALSALLSADIPQPPSQEDGSSSGGGGSRRLRAVTTAAAAASATVLRALDDDAAFALFLACAAACFACSAAYHALGNVSPRAARLWLRADFAGIVALTLGSFASGVYMGFWCEPGLRRFYWSMISVLGALTITVLVNPRFEGPRWRTFRVLCFVGTGFSGFLPLAHGAYLFGLARMMRWSGLPYYLVEGGLLMLGTAIHTTRFPERAWPGRFDIFGSSHQIFHVLVVAAAATHFAGLVKAYDYNIHFRQCGSTG